MVPQSITNKTSLFINSQIVTAYNPGSTGLTNFPSWISAMILQTGVRTTNCTPKRNLHHGYFPKQPTTIWRCAEIMSSVMSLQCSHDKYGGTYPTNIILVFPFNLVDKISGELSFQKCTADARTTFHKWPGDPNLAQPNWPCRPCIWHTNIHAIQQVPIDTTQRQCRSRVFCAINSRGKWTTNEKMWAAA